MEKQPVLQIPHGLADVPAGMAYVAGPDGCILALDLNRGEIVARAGFAAEPLALADGLLIGWRPGAGGPNAVRIVAAIRNGQSIDIVWEATIALPDWADPQALEPDAFALEAEFQDDAVIVRWQASTRYGGGAPPPPEVLEAATRDQQAMVRLDRRTGAPIGPEERSRIEGGSSVSPPDVGAGRRVVPYRSGSSWATAPWRSGAGDAALIKPQSGPGVALLRREAGRDSESTLSTDPGAEAAVTQDGMLIFVSEPSSNRWQVFSAATGEPTASLPFDPGTEAVAALDDRALYEVAEDIGGTRRYSLRCRDLKTGALMWSQALREMTLAAPPPPPP